MNKKKAFWLVPAVGSFAAVLIFAAVSAAGTAGGPVQDKGMVPVKTVTLPADEGWVDTGVDVRRDEAFYFRAKGEVSLQRGNPAASCGPEGMENLSSQQPLPDRNTGAVIGKVVQLIGIRKDEDTGEEIRDEVVEIFYIGRESRVVMPIGGRLFVGVNESVYQDNGGDFKVEILRVKAE